MGDSSRTGPDKRGRRGSAADSPGKLVDFHGKMPQRESARIPREVRKSAVDFRGKMPQRAWQNVEACGSVWQNVATWLLWVSFSQTPVKGVFSADADTVTCHRCACLTDASDGSERSAAWLRTTGVKTNGAAAKVMILTDWGEKGTP